MKALNITINDEPVQVTPENLGIAMFRHNPELDYLDYHEVVEGEDVENHTLLFDQRELLLWMGGVALNEKDAKEIRLAERKLGSFALQSGGWRPQIFIEDYASDWEKEMYVKSQLPTEENWHTDLNRALGEDFAD